MEVRHYFTTPLVFFKNEKLLSELKKYIYKQETNGIESNVATHRKKNLVESKFNLFSSEETAVVETKNFIGTSLSKVINEFHLETCEYKITFTDSWFHVGETNSLHDIHTHGNCSWCGIYYVEIGDEGSGQTAFRNPAYTNYLDLGSRWHDMTMETRIKAENGLLVLFPSYLSHYQSIYTGKKDRIVVAFNAQISAKDYSSVKLQRTKWS